MGIEIRSIVSPDIEEPEAYAPDGSDGSAIVVDVELGVIGGETQDVFSLWVAPKFGDMSEDSEDHCWLYLPSVGNVGIRPAIQALLDSSELHTEDSLGQSLLPNACWEFDNYERDPDIAAVFTTSAWREAWNSFDNDSIESSDSGWTDGESEIRRWILALSTSPLRIGISVVGQSGLQQAELGVGVDGCVRAVISPELVECSISDISGAATSLYQDTGLSRHFEGPGESASIPDSIEVSGVVTVEVLHRDLADSVGGGTLSWIDHGPGFAPGVILQNQIDLGDGAEPVIEVWRAVDVLAELVSYLPPLNKLVEDSPPA